MRRRVGSILSTPWWPALVTFLAVAPVTAAKIAVMQDAIWWLGSPRRVLGPLFRVATLDWLLLAALLLMIAAAAYQFFTRRRARAFGTLGLGIIMAFVAVLGLAFQGLWPDINPLWPWDSAQADLDGGLGRVTLYARPDHPPTGLGACVPGNDSMWKVTWRPEGHRARTTRLPFLISADPYLELYVAEGGPCPVLARMAPGALGLVGGEPAPYIDLRTGEEVSFPEGRIKRVGTFQVDEESGLCFTPYFDGPRANGGLYWPDDVAVDGEDNVCVVEQANDRLVRYDDSGRFLGAMSLPQVGDAIAADTAGNVWVTAWGASEIRKCTPEGKLAVKFESPVKRQAAGPPPFGMRSGPPESPPDVTALACDRSGDVYAAELAGRVTKASPDGRLVAQWDPIGREGRKHPIIHGMALAADGSVLLADMQADCIWRLAPNGKVAAHWRIHSAGQDGSAYPVDVTTDQAGNVYAAVWQKERLYIEKYSPPGEFQLRWAPPVRRYGGSLPRIAASAQHVYVTDKPNHRILRFTTSGAPVPDWGS